MAVNYYGHYHLMELLLPKLVAQQKPSRVVVLTCQKVGCCADQQKALLVADESMVQPLQHTVHDGLPGLRQELDSTTIKLKDLNFGMRSATHDPFKCYKASKIALTLFAKELARRTADTHITVLLADPGVCGETNLFQCVQQHSHSITEWRSWRLFDNEYHGYFAVHRYMGPLVIMFAFAKPFLSTIPQVR